MDEKKPEYDDPEQSARFMETAEQIQADDAEEKFDEAMKRILAAGPHKVSKDAEGTPK